MIKSFIGGNTLKAKIGKISSGINNNVGGISTKPN